MIEKFNNLSTRAKPRPELYHLYFRTSPTEPYQLVKDSLTSTLKIIRLYGPTSTGGVNYTTCHINPDMAKESFAHIKSDTYKVKSTYPSVKIPTPIYPHGVRTYYYTLPSGEKLEFQRGHGIDHADTVETGSPKSTLDAENFVPQNSYYNEHIRNPLVNNILRKDQLNYKEISVFYKDPFHRVKRAGKNNKYEDISIPEGFIFLTFTQQGEIQDTYYFPNFVQYEKLKKSFSSSEVSYKKFLDLYQFKNLEEWFCIPESTQGEAFEQHSRVNLAESLTNRLLIEGSNIFSHLQKEKFSEEQMPPKARIALLATLLEWNAQTAATLEFLDFSQQLSLVHLYTSSRTFYELDERHQAEKNQAIQNFLSDQHISKTARDIVSFLHTRTVFEVVKHSLFELTQILEKFLNPHPSSGEAFPLNSQHYKMMIKDSVYEFDLASLSPHYDLKKLKELIGGYKIYDLTKARDILECIDRRAQLGISARQILDLMRLYRDYPDLQGEEQEQFSKREKFWEETLNNFPEKDLTLIDKRKIADFYGARDLHEKKAIWLKIILTHIQEDPSPSNLLFIADSSYWGMGAFLQYKKEKDELIKPCDILALQIYQYLYLFSDLEDEEKRRAEEMFHFINEKLGSQILSSSLINSSHLKPLLMSKNITGEFIMNFSNFIFKLTGSYYDLQERVGKMFCGEEKFY